MFNRKEYKAKGKLDFKANYWLCVLVSVIIFLCANCSVTYSIRSTGNQIADTQAVMMYGQESVNTYSVSAGPNLSLPVGIINILVLNVICVGGALYFVNNREGKASLNDLVAFFTKEAYGSAVITMFLRSLFTALWCLLLIVPGIIKAYEYCLIPYILAENPGIDRNTAFARSKYLMTGHKWDMFVLDLSFIGWHILSVLTAGILEIFYVNPYMLATKAEAYAALCEMKDSAPAEA